MTATEVRDRQATAAEKGQELSNAVARQVADILADARRQEQARQETRPAVAYRVPAPGIRYYF